MNTVGEAPEMRANELVIGLLAALALSACGDDGGGGGGDPEPVTDQNTLNTGKTTAQNTQSLATIQAGADTAAAQGPVTTVGSSIMTLANQYRAVKLQSMAQGLSVAGLERAQTAGETGTITYENNHLAADLHYTVNTGTSDALIDYVADLDIVPVEGGGYTFDGTFGIAYSGNSAGYDIDYDYDAAYEGLKLDTANCPIAGSLSVDYALSISGGALDMLPAASRAQIEDQIGGEGNITLTFGPNCGDVSAEGT
jgi:hypothetical protein